MAVKEYSLREMKHARTKIAIMNAFIAALEKSRFDDISIKQVCRRAEISEGTFFNYFPEKIDIIHFYIHALLLKAVWQAQRSITGPHILPLIEAVFENLAGTIKNSNITEQLIAAMINQRELPKNVVITAIERELLYPGCEGIENVRVSDIETFFMESLKGALKNGELPKSVNLEDVVVSLMTLLGGTLLASKFADNKNVAYHFRRQLRILWDGLGVKSL